MKLVEMIQIIFKFQALLLPLMLRLETLKYNGVQDAGNIEILVDATDSLGNQTKEKGLINLSVLNNEPPVAGGDLVFQTTSENNTINEDTTTDITFKIPLAKLE